MASNTSLEERLAAVEAAIAPARNHSASILTVPPST